MILGERQHERCEQRKGVHGSRLTLSVSLQSEDGKHACVASSDGPVFSPFTLANGRGSFYADEQTKLEGLQSEQVRRAEATEEVDAPGLSYEVRDGNPFKPGRSPVGTSIRFYQIARDSRGC